MYFRDHDDAQDVIYSYVLCVVSWYVLHCIMLCCVVEFCVECSQLRTYIHAYVHSYIICCQIQTFIL